MCGMPREPIAKDSVFGIIRAATDDVARVEVAHHNRNFTRIKPLFDLLAQKETDIAQPDVSGSVALVCSVSQQLLSRAFGDGNDRVPAFHNPLFQCGEKSAL